MKSFVPTIRRRRSWVLEVAEERQTAIAAWRRIRSREDVATRTGSQMSGLDTDSAAMVLVDTLEVKATSTIRQRAESILLFIRWAEPSGVHYRS